MAGSKRPRSALSVAHRARSAARAATESVERRARAVVAHPRGLVAAGVVGAAALVIARKRADQKVQPLYTDDEGDGAAKGSVEEKCDLREQKALDSDVNTATSQESFDELQGNWTKAAEGYLQASAACPKAQFALGRLCFEGRGYVYDPEFGMQLYAKSAEGGNEDAMYALACILLRSVKAAKAGPVTKQDDREKLHIAKSHMYRASRLLLSARNKKSQTAIDALNQWRFTLDLAVLDDPHTWIDNTSAFLDAAKELDDAKGYWIQRQLEMLPEKENRAKDRNRVLDTLGAWLPARGKGGWRARVARARALHELGKGDLAEIEELMRYTSTGENADPREMFVVSRVAGETLNALDASRGYTSSPESRAAWDSVLSLRDQAGRKGDTSANEHFVYHHSDNYYDSDPSDQRTIETMAVLDRGVFGSSKLRLDRGKMYAKQGNTQSAEADIVLAAELGEWDAMVYYRRSSLPAVKYDPSQYGVEVSPMPAALEKSVTLSHCTVASEVDGRPGPDSRGMWVTWPNLEGKNWVDALSALRSAYESVLSEFAKSSAETLLLHSIPHERFGELAKDAPVLTARALMMAFSRLNPKRNVTVCVFDDPSVVVAYDRAFQSCFRTQPKKEGYTSYNIKLSWATDADHFWANFAKLSSLNRPYSPARVALIIGCTRQPGISMLSPEGSLPTAARNEAELCVFRWLHFELAEIGSESRTELFRATIAGTSEDTVFVHCDGQYWVTLVFARFDPSNNALESARSAIEAAYRAVANNGQTYIGAYVCTKSFVEHVDEPFAPALAAIDLDGIRKSALMLNK